MITRFSRRALPAAVAAALLAGCTSSAGSGDAASGTTSPAATPATTTAPPTPTTTPTPTPKPTGAADPALKPFYGQQIAWTPCADDPATDKVDESAVQCGKLKVPLDYTNPAGDTLEVAVVRNPAAKQDQRVGSLLVNPGGPGGSGVGMVKRNPKQFDGPLHDRFDTIGFDPRGVGLTTPVNCLDDGARDEWVTTDTPGDAHGKVLADACQAKFGKVLPFIGTRNTARDMDVLRAALGDQKLNYFGLSYGTYLGSLYAEEFPDRVGRLVLDGAVDPSVPLAQHNIAQYAAFEHSLEAFAANCATKSSCPLGKDPGAAAGKLADFLDGLKEKPLTTASGRKLTANAAWTAMIDGLYGDEQGWESLRNDVGWAMVRGKGDYLLARADDSNHRDKDGHYSVSADAYTAIHCADGGTGVPVGDDLKAAYAELAAKAPLLTRHEPSFALFDPDCRSWPFRSAEKPHPIASKSDATIVVVGSTGDAATPYASAEKLAAQLGKAVLLTREGEGHTGYGWSKCIRTSVDAFLTDGTVPAAGTRCASDPAG
ncbi:alpha/beta hydrolase [Streptomyces sp. CB01881]|uniref:alpha/beta hydrolase n=1 Tax=Streptomyces sp. CB01881 TaxID=2078691 RepID=UPI000CDCB20C|nr:alpha/beta hydrolase [Streptomyces sp. CB01881]AUY52295.1 alpha/beta hydrolase [Streptomyces sp. CB01881]TYC71717.1 alpha/beta hydrolase [Streptomyces sp. CB01881]